MKRAPLNHPSQNTQFRPFDVVVLAVSAGDHAEITTILHDLPALFSVPVIVMMHLGVETTGTPEVLGRRLPFTVEWMKPDSALVPGKVLICPPQSFVELLPDGTFIITPNERGALDRPIDRLLESIAHSFGERAIGVVLTGMQSDGGLGAHQLHLAGGTVIVRSEDSTEFPNLPKVAIQSGAAEVVLPLNKIASFLVGLVVDDLIPRSPTELEAADFGAFDYSPQTGKLVWDRQMKRLWGLEPDEELKFEHAIERIHAEDRARVGQVVAAALSPEGDGDFQVEFRVVWPDGTVHWHAGKGRVYFEQDPDGKRSPVRLTGVESDITERKQTEEALRESEEKYKTLFNSIDDSFELLEITRDQDGRPRDVRVLEVNLAYERQTGRKAEQVIGHKWSKIEPSIEPYWNEKVFRVAETGQPERYEDYNRERGKIFDAYFFRFAQDRVGALFRDITERKQAEEALRASEEKYRTLFETMEEGFAVTELIRDENKRAVDLRYLALNPRFEALTGLSRADVIGRLRSEVVGVDNWWIQAYQTVRDTGEKVRVEHYVPEHQRWFDITIFPYGGNLFANIFDDITERKRAEEALRENEKQLQSLNETLEQKVQEKTAEVHQLASDLIKATQRERQRISHVLHDDLQQRIYAIQMQLSFLQDGLQSESQQKEVSDIAKGLRDILKITRHLSIDLSPPILRDEGLAHAVGWLAARMQQQYGLPVELQVDGPFIIPNEDLHVLLFNSVRELLFNVVKHAQASRAWVTLQRSEDAIQIEVRDDGRGFSVNALEKQKKENGVPPSLGLPTIRHQLSLFDGSMKINSGPNNGTQVILSVPTTEAG